VTTDILASRRPRGVAYKAAAGLASTVFALALTGSPIMALAVALGIIVVCVGLFSPALLTLAWIGSGPTLSTWLDVRVGPLPALTPDRTLLMVLLALFVTRWVRRPETRLPLGRMELLMAGFLLYAAASVLAGGGSRETSLNLRTMASGSLRLDFVFLGVVYGLPYFSFFMTKNMLWRESHLRGFLVTFICAGTFVALTGILQTFTSISFFVPTRNEVIHQERATGTMTSAGEFGLVVGMPLLAAIIGFLRGKYLSERLLLGGVIAVMSVAIVLAKTRGVWVGVALGLAVAAYYEPGLRRRLGAAALAGTVTLVAAWPLLANTEFIRGRVFDMITVYTRVATTATALNMVAHSPLVGYGFGRYTYDSEKWDYMTGAFGLTALYAYPPGVPHNEFMHILILLGVIGFIPYVAILVIAWRTAAEHYREYDDPFTTPRRDIALIVLSAMALYIAICCTLDAFSLGPATLQLYCLIGALHGFRARRPGAFAR
jgi:O-antigen ligase